MIMYFRTEKARMERQRIVEATKGIGKPKVGGTFDLVDHDGKRFTNGDMTGKYALVGVTSSILWDDAARLPRSPAAGPILGEALALADTCRLKQVYFGFTHCPDICPEELDKMAKMIDNVNQKTSSLVSGSGSVLRPVFITCDPARDTPAVMKAYLREFHPALIGLTGAYDEIKAVCKAYRVYFSTPEHVKPGQDYLVDHSIYFYLMGECLLRLYHPLPLVFSGSRSRPIEAFQFSVETSPAILTVHQSPNFFQPSNHPFLPNTTPHLLSLTH